MTVKLEGKDIYLDENFMNRSMAVASHDAIWDLDFDKHEYAIEFNRDTHLHAYIRNKTYAFDEWVQLIHEEDRAHFISVLEAFRAGRRKIFECVYRVIIHECERWILTRGIEKAKRKGVITAVCGTHTDITENDEIRMHLSKYIFYDSMTSLPKRSWIKKKWGSLQNGLFYRAAFLYVDIDNIGHINNSFGHEIGDEAIRVTGQRLLDVFKETAYIARLSGDAFLVIVDRIAEDHSLVEHLDLLYRRMKAPAELEAHTLHINISIGVAKCPDHGTAFSDLIKAADIALFHAKKNGKNRCEFFTEEMGKYATYFSYITNQIRLAIERDEFSMHYHPIMRGNLNRVAGAEALIRWKHPSLGHIPPSDFIPYAESIGFMTELERWIIHEVFGQIKRWRETGSSFDIISLNLSSKGLLHDGLVDYIISQVALYEINPGNIQLEITETAIINDIDKAVGILQRLSDMGFIIALDDFGTGYSSLNYLRKLPTKVLKLDRDFIQSISSQFRDYFIIATIIDMAKALDIEVIAEGVENSEQLSKLKVLGCDMIQGFYYSKPLPADKFIEWKNTYENDVHVKLNVEVV